jgi:hypothetical protein
MAIDRFALLVGALLVSALASCSSGSTSSASDGGQPQGDGGGFSSPDGSADSTGSMDGFMGGGDDASDGAVVDAGACPLPPEGTAPNCFSAFAQIGPTVVTTACMGGQLPQAQGGSIPDGIYTLQSRAMYAASCPSTVDMEGTLVICPRQWDWVLIYDPFPDSGNVVPGTYEYNYAATFGAGGSVVLTPKCTSDLDTRVDMLDYTFAAGQLTLISAQTNTVSTYVKM